jgi:hypothetical protein
MSPQRVLRCEMLLGRTSCVRIEVFQPGYHLLSLSLHERRGAEVQAVRQCLAVAHVRDVGSPRGDIGSTVLSVHGSCW